MDSSQKSTELKQQVVKGLKWSVLAKLFTQVFSWVSTFYVIRHLAPSDYGVVALAMVFFALITLFTNNGLINALVRQQDLGKRPADLIFTLSLLLNVTLSGILALSAPYIAQWYDNESLTNVLWVLAAVNPLISFSVVPQAHLQISMRFKEKAIAESSAGFAGAIVAALGAYLGEAYWALIYANIAMTVVRVIEMNRAAKASYGITTSFKGAKDTFLFAFQLQINSLIWFAYSRADMILVARLLGVDKAGIYNVSSQVASIPMDKINAVMGEVAFSAFSKTRDDIEKAKGYLKKALRLMAVVALPMFYGIASVSDEVVHLLMGEQWASGGPIIMLLCLVLPFRMLVSVMGNFATGMGEAKFGLQNGVLNAIIMITAIAIGAQYGLIETAMSWIIGFAVLYATLMIRYYRKFSLPLSTMLVYYPVFFISLGMFLVIKGVEFYFSIYLSQWEVWQVFLSKVLIGLFTAGPLLLLGYGKELKDLVKR